MIEHEPRNQSIKADILSPDEPGWNNKIDELRLKLGAPQNPDLFPPHFVKKTLISIGGSVIEFSNDNHLLGAGFIFPRRIGEERGFTLRFHNISPVLSSEAAFLLTKTAINDRSKQPIHMYLYVLSELPELPELPENDTNGFPSENTVQEEVSIERTLPNEGSTVRDLQREIWGVTSDDFLYPGDIHTKEFALPTSLIAHIDGKAAGFLFGFDKFYFGELPDGLRELISNPFIRQESQLMGVLSDHRFKNIATRLKVRQAQEAIRNGTEIINWTYDPLLSQNGALNLNKLGGVVWDHSPNYYAFSGANKLNQVIASRFSVSWLISSPRVKGAIGGMGRDERLREAIKEELLEGNVPIINLTKENDSIEGEDTRTTDDNYAHFVDENVIAIEIPTNWISIQGKDISLAQQWRQVTDEIFGEYIGLSRGKYVITDVVTFGRDGSFNRAFLVARSIDQIQNIFLGEV